MFAAKKIASIPPNTTPVRMIRQVGQCQRSRATMSSSTVVIRNVPVTARPYAVANFTEDSKASMRLSTPTNSAPLTAGRYTGARPRARRSA